MLIGHILRLTKEDVYKRQMIGSAAYYEFINGVRDGLDLNANPSLKLGEK